MAVRVVGVLSWAALRIDWWGFALTLLAILSLCGGCAPASASDLDLPIALPETRTAIPEDTPTPPEESDPPKLYDEEVPTTSDSLIYVIDCSGSMNLPAGAYTDLDGNVVSQGTRIEIAKAELSRSIRALPESYEFNVIAYQCAVWSWRSGRQRAAPANKASAIAWVNGLYANDGTATAPGVVMALQDRSNYTIALLTDGAPGCGEPDPINSALNVIVQNNIQRAKIHCFGIGCYEAFEQFLRDLATASGGRFYKVAGS